jgi:multiple sugar transport system ATP-binding protein
MVEVVLDSVSKFFGDVKAVDGVSLKVLDKEFLTLLGPSGCGKTTTLRLIAGLEELSGGDIHIGDRKVNDLAPRDRNIAMVFQSYALYPHMSVFDNMAFPLKIRKVPKSELDKRVRESAELLGISELLKRKPKELSGGQRQRVALGRAIVRSPDVFLMDEPLSNLDAKMRVYMRAELKRLQKKLGTTLIYVTHDQVEAMTMSDRVAIMNDGKLQQLDIPETVYQHPNNIWVAGFIGSPAMNFFDCTFKSRDGGGLLDAGEFSIDVGPDVADIVRKSASGPEVILGIRPEDISVAKKRQPGSIEASVYVLEPIGDSVIVDANVGENLVKARADASFMAEIEEKVYLTFNQSKIHVFDKKQQTAIL